MAKAYWVVCYRSISDSAAREEYTKLAVPAVLAGGGRYLARGGVAKLMKLGLISAPYWSSSTASPRRLLLMTAPTTRPHSLSWAMRQSATFASSKLRTTERMGIIARPMLQVRRRSHRLRPTE
jgi:hypothetical protein